MGQQIQCYCLQMIQLFIHVRYGTFFMGEQHCHAECQGSWRMVKPLGSWCWSGVGENQANTERLLLLFDLEGFLWKSKGAFGGRKSS